MRLFVFSLVLATLFLFFSMDSSPVLFKISQMSLLDDLQTGLLELQRRSLDAGDATVKGLLTIYHQLLFTLEALVHRLYHVHLPQVRLLGASVFQHPYAYIPPVAGFKEEVVVYAQIVVSLLYSAITRLSKLFYGTFIAVGEA